MKSITLLLSLGLALCSSLQAQSPLPEVILGGALKNCQPTDSFRIYSFVGTSLQPLGTIPLTAQEGQHVFGVSLKQIPVGFYFISVRQNQTLPIILGSETNLYLQGDANNFQAVTVNNTPINLLYQQAMKRMDEYSVSLNNLAGQYRMVAPGSSLPDVDQQMRAVDLKRYIYLDSLSRQSSFVHKAALLKAYTPYQLGKKGNEDELLYIAREYLSKVDTKDPAYQQMPLLFEKCLEYGKTVGDLGLATDELMEFSDRLVNGLDPKSNAFANVTLGLAQGFLQSRHIDCFYKYANLYVTNFEQLNPMLTSDLKRNMAAQEKFLNGKPAMDIKALTPDGTEYALSQMKGKVVFVDFWASWCRPCRKENPRAIKLYNAYKDKNFDILGVSLDQSKEQWAAAITQDGLPWKHVSDLGGWNSAPAKLYGVSSIPYAMLVDAEGNILDKKLRGEALERKLARIYAK